MLALRYFLSRRKRFAKNLQKEPPKHNVRGLKGVLETCRGSADVGGRRAVQLLDRTALAAGDQVVMIGAAIGAVGREGRVGERRAGVPREGAARGRLGKRVLHD